MTRTFKTLLVTGGAGFMGSNFIRFILRQTPFAGRIVTVDKLTYAGDPDNLADLAPEEGQGRFRLVVADICDGDRMRQVFRDEGVDGVVHFAAESHVDRSIAAADAFGRTNILGTLTLIETARDVWGGRRDVLYHQISTDEVFGSCPEGQEYAEDARYDPSSPYAASKASADHLVRSFGHTHKLPCTITNASNNYGPHQTPEKLIPLVILRLINEASIPVYGMGDNVREWTFVDDHSQAVWDVITRGRAGESYNVGSGERLTNLELIHALARETAELMGRPPDFHRKLITYVADRPGHDKRYAIDSRKLRAELGFAPIDTLAHGLRNTVRWYLENEAWVARAGERLKGWIAEEGALWARKRG